MDGKEQAPAWAILIIAAAGSGEKRSSTTSQAQTPFAYPSKISVAANLGKVDAPRKARVRDVCSA
jgi:hypothetical protein